MTSNKQSDENDNFDTVKQTQGLASGKTERALAIAIFHLIEQIMLIIVVVMTLGAVAFEIQTVYLARTIAVADILLMFLYLEIIGMVSVFYLDPRSVFAYPIFIAITAIARLIVLQGKDMAPENILYEAIAILILSIAAIVITRVRNDR